MNNCTGYTRSPLAAGGARGGRARARAGIHSHLEFEAGPGSGSSLIQTRTRSMPPSLAMATYSGIQLLPRIWLAISTTM